MKKIAGFLFFLPLLVCACRNKNKSIDDVPISAVSIIKGQINHLDTSLYQFTKYETVNGKTDTIWTNREEAKKLAGDFLSLPDITQKNYRSQYTEERLIDAAQNTLSITSTAKNEAAEIQKQIIIISLDKVESGNVSSIFIDRLKQVKDSLIEQKLFWEIDKYFQIGKMIQVKNQPEKSQILKVAWE